jgi:hypothetical protein
MNPRKRLPAVRPNITQLLAPKRMAGRPEPGFFQLKLVRHGPWVRALIWRPCPLILPKPGLDEHVTPAPEDWCLPTERARPLRATIGEREVDPQEVWERGQRITAKQYHYLAGVNRHAVRHAPTAPEAQPRQPVNLTITPSLF